MHPKMDMRILSPVPDRIDHPTSNLLKIHLMSGLQTTTILVVSTRARNMHTTLLGPYVQSNAPHTEGKFNRKEKKNAHDFRPIEILAQIETKHSTGVTFSFQSSLGRTNANVVTTHHHTIG